LKLGLCSIAALQCPLGEVAELAAKQGLDGIEVTARPPHLTPEATEREARAASGLVRAAGIEVLAYGSYLGLSGAGTPGQAEREAAVAAALGAPLWRVWAEPSAGAGEEEGFTATVALLRAACEAARRHEVTVVVERHVGSFADTPERVERLLGAVDRDDFALNYQVLDLLPAAAAALQPDDARRLAGHARYFHLKNYRPNPDGGPMLPWATLEGGTLDYRAILGAAFEAGYTGPLAIEFLSSGPEPLHQKLAADVAYLRALLAELGRT
jgi:sugar phosphate isomerase/epimerase